MTEWKYRCFLHKGADIVRSRYEDSSREVKAKFFSKLSILRPLDQAEWRRPPFENLHADGKGIGEIRFEAGGLQHRPLGFHIPEKRQFILVVWATKKGSKWDPRNAIEIAQTRKQEVLEDDSKACELDWLSFE